MGYAYKIRDQQGLYFLTCTITQWIDVFTRRCYADIVVDSLNYCILHKGLRVYGWVIMSNHIHLIVSCEEEAKLSDILRDFKKFTSKQIVVAIEANNKESRKNWLLWLLKPKGEITFWQPDNHAETILSEAFFNEKLNYIHNNPVKSGFVDQPDAYPYSSAYRLGTNGAKIRLSYII